MRRDFSRRQFIQTLGVATIGAGGLLAACGGGGSAAPTPTPPQAQVPPEIADEARKYKGKTLATLSQRSYFPASDTAYEQALKAFADTTGITINNTQVNVDSGDTVAKLDAAVKSGDVQDVMYVQASRFVSQFHQLGDIVDVTDVVETLEKAYGPAPDIAKNTLQIGGKWWGIPYFTALGAWFARKDWLSAKGIKLSEIKTFSDARDAALEISDPSQNRYGWGVTLNRSGDANGFIENVINAYGGSLTNDEGTKVTFNSSETKQAVSFLAETYTGDKYKKMLPPGIQSWTDTGNNEAWLAGIIGFTTNQISLYAQSKAQKNPVYDVTQPFVGLTGPATSRPIQAGDLQAYVVFKNAKQPDLAKLIARYMVAGKPMLELAKVSNGLVLPMYQNVWTSDSFYLKGDPLFKIVHDVMTEPLPIRTKNGLNFPQAPSPGSQAVRAGYVLTDMMGDVVQKGVKVNDAVRTATDRMVALFNQLGLKQ